MPYTEAQFAAIAKTLPSTETTRKKLEDWRSRANLTLEQVAHLSGYGLTGIKRFVAGTYHLNADSDVLIRRAIEQAMARFPVGALRRSPEPLYETENVAALRELFNRCQQNRSIAVIYGPPGSQKTFTLKHLIFEHNQKHLSKDDGERAHYAYATMSMKPRDMLRRLCEVSGVKGGQTILSCISGLKLSLRDTRTLFVIDEAQHLPLDSLEVLRELHDEDPEIGILLTGSHSLKHTFNVRAAELEQWNRRISAVHDLAGASHESAMAILEAELPGCKRAVYDLAIKSAYMSDRYNGGKKYLSVGRLVSAVKEYRANQAQKVAHA